MARAPLHDRLFRALLKLFPSEFLGDFGKAMTEDFRDQQREAEGRPRQARRLWIRTVVDLLRRAPREHLDVLGRDAVYDPRPTPLVVVLADSLWRGRFGSDPDVVGKQIRVAGGDRIDIVGVMGPELQSVE